MNPNLGGHFRGSFAMVEGKIVSYLKLAKIKLETWNWFVGTHL